MNEEFFSFYKQRSFLEHGRNSIKVSFWINKSGPCLPNYSCALPKCPYCVSKIKKSIGFNPVLLKIKLNQEKPLFPVTCLGELGAFCDVLFLACY